MDEIQPTPTPSVTTVTAPVSPTPDVFKTKLPSTIAFAIGILVFLLPFIDIKCNNMSIQKVSGVQLATGFNIKAGSDDSFLGKMDKIDTGAKKTENKEPNIYALIALLLGVVGLALSFVKAKSAISGSLLTGALAAVSLIVLMIDVKSKVKNEMKIPDTGGGTDDLGIGKMTESIGITVDFAPAFYIAIVAFLAAAFFCYKRMQGGKG